MACREIPFSRSPCFAGKAGCGPVFISGYKEDDMTEGKICGGTMCPAVSSEAFPVFQSGRLFVAGADIPESQYNDLAFPGSPGRPPDSETVCLDGKKRQAETEGRGMWFLPATSFPDRQIIQKRYSLAGNRSLERHPRRIFS